jgi:putative DNA primase/helicase
VEQRNTTFDIYLSEEHRRALVKESGISEEVIAARGYWTEHDPEVLAELGFDERQRALVPALVIPIRDISGDIVLHRIRPDNPRPSSHKPGRLNKYEMPTGARNVLDVPTLALEGLRDVNQPLWIVEGEKKADSLVSRGEVAVALFGVWSWKRWGFPLPDFDAIPMITRDVNIVFDSDAGENVNIRKGLVCLARYVRGRVGDA